MFNSAMAGSKNSISNTTVHFDGNKVEIGYGWYCLLHIISGYDPAKLEPHKSPKSVWYSWRDDTLLFATFDGSLSGGNVEMIFDSGTSIKIKRKEYDAPNSSYITILEKKINNIDDAAFVVYDNYAKAQTKYVYAACIVAPDGTEGALCESDSVESSFCGVVICDTDCLYSSELETDYSFDKNSIISTVNTLTSRYPYIIHNNLADFWSGSISGMWVERDCCEYNLENQFKFRKDFYDWLNNGNPKILKLDDGREWLVCVTGGIKEHAEGHWLKVITSFDWTEIGNCDSSDDLYKCGLVQQFME